MLLSHCNYHSNLLLPFEHVAVVQTCCRHSKLLPSNSATIVPVKRTIIQTTNTPILKPSFLAFTGIDMASLAIKICKLIDPKVEYLVDLDASIQETMLT